MKKFFLLSSLLMLILSGCSTPEGMTVYGTKCKVLSEDQTADLIRFCRKTLYKNAQKYKISPEEMNIIRKTEPDLRAEYRGDCYGTLLIAWETPSRKIGLRFENHLDAEIPSGALAIATSDGKNAGTIQPNKILRGR